jgi:uncharacterized membrane protein
MNRKEIKEEAKAKYKNNKLNIWLPLLIWGVITSIISLITKAAGVEIVTSTGAIALAGNIYSLIIAMLQSLFIVCYYKYILNFVRTGKFESFKETLPSLKEKWPTIILGYILINIFTSIGYVLLIVPGIILTLGFSMFYYIIADSKEEDAMDGLKKSWQLMKGYKWDYFVFNLSFLGYYILCVLTLGILCIWVVPYCNTAFAIYYEKLQQTKTISKE